MNNYIFLSSMLIFLLMGSCVDTEPEAPPNNDEDLLFLQAEPLFADQIIVDGQIAFRVYSPVPAFFRIALFTRPPRVADGRLQNDADIIWRYDARPSINSTIILADGIFEDDAPVLDEAFFGCDPTGLYWGAWGFERTATHITHSTSRNLVVSTPDFSPEISLTGTQLIGIRNAADTMVFPGGTAHVELTFQNVGTEEITEGSITIAQDNLLNFSKSIPISNLPIGGHITDTIAFTLPTSLVFRELIPFEVSFQMNDCFMASSSFAYRVNVTSYRVEKIVLLDFSAPIPPSGWDPGLETELNLPDPFYRLFKVSLGDTVQIHESNTMTEVDTFASPVADWDDLPETLSLALNTQYLIKVFDANPPTNDSIGDHFIGYANFSPRQLFPGRLPFYPLDYPGFVLQVYTTYSE